MHHPRLLLGDLHSIAETVFDNSAFGRTTYLYQLGDHDPSGLDAWRSFQERVREFVPWAAVEFERLAVTPGQVGEWDLPTRPTKTSDTRSAGFVGGSVEVDAIPPSTLRQLVREAIEQHIDPRALRLTWMAERSERDLLTDIAAGTW